MSGEGVQPSDHGVGSEDERDGHLLSHSPDHAHVLMDSELLIYWSRDVTGFLVGVVGVVGGFDGRSLAGILGQLQL